MSEVTTQINSCDIDDIATYVREQYGKDPEVRAVDVFGELIHKVYEGRDILEIGAGRRPMLPESLHHQIRSYTINDISKQELDLAPDTLHKVVYDFSDHIPETEAGKYDLIFSSMVLEHVKSGSRFFDNLYFALKPGGISLHLHPTLFAPPMVANYLFPEKLTKPLLIAFRPHRTDEDTPKFPARYSYCYSTGKHIKRLKGKGFSKVTILPFWKHTYYRNIPVLEAVRKKIARVAHRRNWRHLTTNAITLVQK